MSLAEQERVLKPLHPISVPAGAAAQRLDLGDRAAALTLDEITCALKSPDTPPLAARAVLNKLSELVVRELYASRLPTAGYGPPRKRRRPQCRRGRLPASRAQAD